MAHRRRHLGLVKIALALRPEGGDALEVEAPGRRGEWLDQAGRPLPVRLLR